MYSSFQNVFFENLLIAEYFNCHNDFIKLIQIYTARISSVVVFYDHDSTVAGKKI
jgi:hypothetical protein